MGLYKLTWAEFCAMVFLAANKMAAAVRKVEYCMIYNLY